MKSIFLTLLMAVSITVHAEQMPLPMPGDNRLVTFTFDANNTYTVLTIPDAVTNIQLMADEKITAMAVGDSIQWIIAKADGHVFVKPTKPNIFTSATIVTDKRSYQLTLRSSPPGGKWYQRVSWNYPDVLVYQQKLVKETKSVEEEIEQKLEEKRQALESIVVSDQDQKGYPVENLNFNYDVKGNAPFRPKQVFDDGKFTYIALTNYQELPALFLKDEKGKFELVNYIRDGNYLKVQRTFKSAVLKLGNREVMITNQSANRISSMPTAEYSKQVIPGF
jgi:type IV secretion system protein VirB9